MLPIFQDGGQQRQQFLGVIRLRRDGDRFGHRLRLSIPLQLPQQDIRYLVGDPPAGQAFLDERLGVCTLRHKEGLDQQADACILCGFNGNGVVPRLE